MPKRSKTQKLHTKMKTIFDNKAPGKKQTNTSTNQFKKEAIDAKNVKGSHLRDAAKIRLLRLYDKKPNWEEVHKKPTKPVRIEPNRKWFGNIRTIDQKSLESFRVELAQQSNSVNHMLLAKRKLPYSLLAEPTDKIGSSLLQFEKFEVYSFYLLQDTFGPKARRKRVKLETTQLEEIATKCNDQDENYHLTKDSNIPEEFTVMKDNKDKYLEAGQSSRIWSELYKVLDSSDVVIQVLDARDPQGTRCMHIENHLRKNHPHKHLVFIINKCDLIPTHISKKWIQILSQIAPTIAFRASLKNPFGKNSLMTLLRQFDRFHHDKKTISVGFIGYPNVGKSSIINSLKEKKVCRAAPIPGETKVWQYVHMTKRIYLIDCPGVVYNLDGEDEVETVLKGVVRTERIKDPDIFIPAILERVEKKVMKSLYKIEDWEDTEDFLLKVAQRKGKLLKGGEPDIKSVSKLIITDWQRGEIPYFVGPREAKARDEKKAKIILNPVE